MARRRSSFPADAKPRQRQGLAHLQKAVADAVSASTQPDCKLAVGMLVDAARVYGRGDRLVQPVAPGQQPVLLSEWKRLGSEFQQVERKIIARCAKGR
jgi:hypothetical protein